MPRLLPFLLGCAVLAGTAFAASPMWIWGTPSKTGELRFFRHEFNVTSRPRRALLTLAGDDEALASLNEKGAGKNDNWRQPSEIDVTRLLQPGPNSLTLLARNAAGDAGILAQLEITFADGTQSTIVSDATWEASSDGATDWVPARVLAPHGAAPWGPVLKGRSATAAETLRVAPGFSVELLRSAQSGEGSWISMTFDPKGRLWISPQGPEPFLRSLPNDTAFTNFTRIQTPARAAMGLAWAFDSLYVNGRGTNGTALYRLQDTDQDDTFDRCTTLLSWKGEGEHGSHGVVADGNHLYVVNGNFVDIPESLSPHSPFRNPGIDLPLPPIDDGNGFASGRKPPGGFILRMNPDGSEPELFSAGLRNAYDIAFNTDGELFTFDSDMEGDWGLPWYRPNRILHCFPGVDHGFREGSGKWPADYPDSLPGVADVGLGSPTGITFGTGTRFPQRYQRALFALDWSFGRILALHLRPVGASYVADLEPIVQGRPLNLTDCAVGPDGALYFITGGRGIQSGLYRLRHTNAEPVAAVPEPEGPEAEARLQRRELSTLARKPDPARIDTLWPVLASPDATLRYAARIALEHLPTAAWKDRALAETNRLPGLSALLALARVGDAADQPALLGSLARWPLDSLPQELFLLKLRVIELSFARHGLPDPTLQKLALEKLGRQFPANSWPVNRELVQLLVALGDPLVVPKALELRDSAPTPQQAIHYQAALRLAREGWDEALHQRYFAGFHQRPRQPLDPVYAGWFREVGIAPANGSSFEGYFRLIRAAAVARLPDNDKGSLAAWINGSALTNRTATLPRPSPARPQRAFVRNWKFDDLAPRLASAGNPTRGRQIYAEAQCASCHRLGGEGGAVGPDLTGAGARYAPEDLLRSLLDPSAVVSELWQGHTLTLDSGETVSGRLNGESASAVSLLVDPLTGRTVDFPKTRIRSRSASSVSLMPEGLLNTFREEEILDLVAYLAKPNP